MKHIGGWRLEQPGPGVFRWRSRAGMTYLVAARPVAGSLPAPVPAVGGRRRLPPERSYPPQRRGFACVGVEAPPSRTVQRDGRIDPTIVFVGSTGPSDTYPDEPPF